MKLSDERVIEFLYESPLKSFAGILDALRYVDDVPVPYESETELVDDALGDEVEQEPKVRVPEIRGIPPIALLAFIEHSHSFGVLKRHPRMPLDKASQKISSLYELTPSGRYVIKILEALTDASSLPLS
jgi:hypothetical protein